MVGSVCTGAKAITIYLPARAWHNAELIVKSSLEEGAAGPRNPRLLLPTRKCVLLESPNNT
jgi:hypothetical protein